MHPDVNHEPGASAAFVRLTELFNAPDYDLRVASGVQKDGHIIEWTMKSGLKDRLEIVKSIKFDSSFDIFYTKVAKAHIDSIDVAYGEGFWFLEDCYIDGRSSIWIAKRLAAAINKAPRIHANITPKTVVLSPSKHGLKLDGWFYSIKENERLETEIANQIKAGLEKRIGNRFNISSVEVTFIDVTQATKDRINMLNAERANTRIAEQRAKTAAAEAESNRVLSESIKNDPNVLVSKCLDAVNEGKSLPAGFQCWPGTSGSVVVPAK